MHALLRSGAALLFMQHGVQKLIGGLGGVDGKGATVPLYSIYGLAGVLELLGGALLLAGLMTRPVALVLAGEMLVAYAMAHMPKGIFPVQNGGELALLYALAFAFLFANGAGPFSLDGWMRRRRGDPDGARPEQDTQVPEIERRRRETAA